MQRLNPLTWRELSSRISNSYTPAALMIFAAIVGGITFLIYLGASLGSSEFRSGPRAVGQPLYWIIMGTEIVIAAFVVPALAATAISKERETHTLDLLRLTPSSAWHIVWSKWLSTVAYVSLFMLVALPLLTIAYLLGGIEIAQVAIGLWIAWLGAICFVALALLISTTARSSVSANILSYGVVLSMLIGLPLFTLVITAISSSATPGSALERVIAYGSYLLICLSPLGAYAATEIHFANTSQLMQFSITLTSAGATPTVISVLPPVVIFTVAYAILTIVCLIAAMRRLARME